MYRMIHRYRILAVRRVPKMFLLPLMPGRVVTIPYFGNLRRLLPPGQPFQRPVVQPLRRQALRLIAHPMAHRRQLVQSLEAPGLNSLNVLRQFWI
jgi:hypothetical protein